ncbi:hypothetical protein V1514DRAFT_330883 [Lipomyces japonicus]|uniref:uncharacterized protein n=1 Tax=Lipomyces japonicus TaxID=56871 RepID=UPI0034CD7812
MHDIVRLGFVPMLVLAYGLLAVSAASDSASIKATATPSLLDRSDSVSRASFYSSHISTVSQIPQTFSLSVESITTTSISLSPSTSTSFVLSSSSSTLTASSSSSSTSSILPYAFDSSLGVNFTEDSCPEFFRSFLSDPDFIECWPFSFFLQNSQSFFNIVKQGAFTLSSTMDMICSVNGTSCSSIMYSYARQLITKQNCGNDYALQNPQATQAFNAFVSYGILYASGCLQSASGSYCYVDSVTNSSNPGDSYLYYLPLDISLPGGTRSSCSNCSQNIMSVFYKYAGYTSFPLSRTYVAAAEQINVFCGPGFVNTAVSFITPSSTHSVSPAPTNEVKLIPLIGAVGAVSLACLYEIL